ncbi:alpha/beta hydrolase [Bacillus sp. SA1-12]|uniref:alpha/beta hydrolase n=1 Tax=Bacillus sp. SA1-12 TaxID=1455638 RepID=UPI0006269E48|nr:alpha/beta hydrolase [Bacillus sp. SA1-12]KKI93456.1 alpha/beta hydrolase [Bacillus sp. SA1-12]
MEQRSWLTMSDGHDVFLTKWYAENVKPLAILQLAHGMAEHIDRYKGFANTLVSEGIFVYGNDLRGHGKTGEKSGTLGFFAEENGFERAVDDLYEINAHIHKQHPNTPVFFMGHSMGSFLVRRFLQRYHGAVRGVILSGTGGNPGLMGKIGKRLAKSQIQKLGKKTESPLMNKLTFGSYNKKLSNIETKFDWLTSDRAEVQKYIADPHCGYVATAGFYYDLLSGLETIHKHHEMAKVDKELPFFFISGDQDPVGQYTKGVMNVIRQFQEHGIKKIDYTFYKRGRHEMLNETNREEVMTDIIQWIKKKLANGEG